MTLLKVGVGVGVGSEFADAVTPQKKDRAIEIKIRVTPNFNAPSHSVGNKVLIDFIMPCLFIYFATIET